TTKPPACSASAFGSSFVCSAHSRPSAWAIPTAPSSVVTSGPAAVAAAFCRPLPVPADLAAAVLVAVVLVAVVLAAPDLAGFFAAVFVALPEVLDFEPPDFFAEVLAVAPLVVAGADCADSS